MKKRSKKGKKKKMKKPIRVTDEMIARMQEAFLAECKRAKLADGKVNFQMEFKADSKDARKVHIHFTQEAYEKMIAIIDEFASEVAWHGLVDRENDDTFIITDILVYPQMVTGATVNTDQEEYVKWLDEIEPEDFNRMHFQGHSHVNMGVTPSAVDLTHQGEIVKQLAKDDFYIFMIWNKSRRYTAKVYDMKTNTLFEGDDVEVTYDYEDPFEDFIKNAKAMVRTKTYATAKSYSPTTAAPYTGSTPGSNYYNQRAKTHWWEEFDSDFSYFGEDRPSVTQGSQREKKKNDVYTGGQIDYSNLKGAGA